MVKHYVTTTKTAKLEKAEETDVPYNRRKFRQDSQNIARLPYVWKRRASRAYDHARYRSGEGASARLASSSTYWYNLRLPGFLGNSTTKIHSTFGWNNGKLSNSRLKFKLCSVLVTWCQQNICTNDLSVSRHLKCEFDRLSFYQKLTTHICFSNLRDVDL